MAFRKVIAGAPWQRGSFMPWSLSVPACLIAVLILALSLPAVAQDIHVLQRVSVTTNGSQGIGPSEQPSITSDGRFVAFWSLAALDPADDDTRYDAYLRDTCVGAPPGCSAATLLLSPVDDGFNLVGLGPNSRLGISANGRYVSFAGRPVALDFSGVFVRDTCINAPEGCTPATILVSVGFQGAQANASSEDTSMSATGRYVAFTSQAGNLVSADAPIARRVFLRDTCIGATECVPATIHVSVPASGADPNQAAEAASISADGRLVAFQSRASNLIAADTNAATDVFVRDTCIGAIDCIPSTVIVSVATDGTQTNLDSGAPAISANGRAVVFWSQASNLAAPDTNTDFDHFLRDTCYGAVSCTPSTTLVSVSADGNASNGTSNDTSAAISADGRMVAFGNSATNLVAGDTNGNFDIFLRDTCFGTLDCTPVTVRVNVSAGAAQANSGSQYVALSSGGEYVAFSSGATNLIDAIDDNGEPDVFLAGAASGLPAAGGTQSDAALDFSGTQNPNGLWSYGWSASRGATFTLYDTTINTGSLIGWRRSSPNEPVILKNISGDVVNPSGTNPIQPGQLVAHPGSGGENNVLRWTAPDSGIYQINVTFTGSDTVGTTTDVAVLHGATQLFSGNVNGYGNQQTFSGLRSVNAGDTIDFALGHGGNGFFNDTTAIDAQVALFEPPALGAPDTQGTEFWLAFMPNNSSSELSLFIAGQTSTTGLVEIPALSFSQNFSVTPGAVTTVSIPTAAVNFGSNVADDLGIHVVAEAEVTVYGLNRLSATTDAFLGLPIDILGTEYLVMGYGGGAGSVMTVVATEDNTAVTISQGASNFAPTLNRGQRFQVALADVTGALVTSDKPVAVFGGNRCTNVPAGFSACDHLVEQIPPTVTWGTQFVTMPLATRLGGDTFRILASADNTIVTVNGTTVATLNRGQFHERIINGPSEIVATSPVLVAQYSNGSGFDGVTSDPFMMLIPPFEQFLNNYTITTPASGFATNFVNIVAASFAVGAISVDGTPVPANNFVAIGTSGFSGVQVPITVGSHNLTSAFPFGAFVYGFASFDSYGYPGGASQSPIATVDSISLTDLEPGTFEAGTEACFEVLVLDSGEVPVADIRVDFAVTGTNLTSGFDTTDESGNAGFCYTGEFGGTDTVRASVGALSSQVNKAWTPGQADVVLQALPGPTVSGVNLVYQVRVRNDGPAGASAVVVSDTLTNFQLVAISSTQGGCSGTSGFASCNVGNMRVGTSADITVTVFAGGGAGWARHSFSAGGSGIDPDLTNNLKAISFGSNQAPAAVAGANRTVPGISLSGTPVTLDGGASSDPNGDALTYRWTGPFPEGGGVVGGRTPTVTLAFGTSKVSLVVSDGGLESAPSDVLVTVSDFGVAVAGGLPSIAAGQSTSYTVTVSSIHGAFAREVALGCGGLPAFTRCTVSPVKVTPNGTSATATLTITTNATLAANPASNAVHLAWLLVFPVAGVVMFAGQRRRRTCLLGALLALALLQVACGGGGTTTSSMPVNRTPAGVHTITVNASSGALTHSSAVTVTVR